MKRKPLFRFLGRPQGGVRQQFEAAVLAQQLYFRLTREDGAPAATAIRAYDTMIRELREKLSVAGVAVADPPWLAALLEK